MNEYCTDCNGECPVRIEDCPAYKEKMNRREWDTNEVFNRWFMENLINKIVKPYALPFTQRDFTEVEKAGLELIRKKYLAGELSANVKKPRKKRGKLSENKGGK